MYCPTCGSDNQPDVRFCRRCGTSLEAVSLALKRQGEDRPSEKSQLSELIKNYYSGRHEMILGLASVALGIAIPGALLATGKSGPFWIFVWIFMEWLGMEYTSSTKAGKNGAKRAASSKRWDTTCLRLMWGLMRCTCRKTIQAREKNHAPNH